MIVIKFFLLYWPIMPIKSSVIFVVIVITSKLSNITTTVLDITANIVQEVYFRYILKYVTSSLVSSTICFGCFLGNLKSLIKIA